MIEPYSVISQNVGTQHTENNLTYLPDTGKSPRYGVTTHTHPRHFIQQAEMRCFASFINNTQARAHGSVQ